jgi:hypothetical protein
MLLGFTVVLHTLIGRCNLDFQDPLKFEQMSCRAALVHYEELVSASRHQFTSSGHTCFLRLLTRMEPAT